MDQVYLNRLEMRLSGPRTVPNGPGMPKSYPKKTKEKSLSLNQDCQGS